MESPVKTTAPKMSKAPASIEKVIFIDTCRDCKKHRGTTWHDESKYEANYNQVKAAIESLTPDVKVQRKEDETVNVGAFEILHKGKILFSKKASGLWPNAKAVAQRVKSYFEDLEQGHDTSHYGKQKERAYVPKKLSEGRTFSGATEFQMFSPKGSNPAVMSQTMPLSKPKNDASEEKQHVVEENQKAKKEQVQEKAAEPVHEEKPKKAAEVEHKEEAQVHTEDKSKPKVEEAPKSEKKVEDAPVKTETESAHPEGGDIQKKDEKGQQEEQDNKAAEQQKVAEQQKAAEQQKIAEEETQAKAALKKQQEEQAEQAKQAELKEKEQNQAKEAEEKEQARKEEEEKKKKEEAAVKAAQSEQETKVENNPPKTEESATLKKEDEPVEDEYAEEKFEENEEKV